MRVLFLVSFRIEFLFGFNGPIGHHQAATDQNGDRKANHYPIHPSWNFHFSLLSCGLHLRAYRIFRETSGEALAADPNFELQSEKT